MLFPVFLVAMGARFIACVCAVAPVLLLFSFNAGYPFFLHLECVFDLGSLTHPYGVTGLLISSLKRLPDVLRNWANAQLFLTLCLFGNGGSEFQDGLLEIGGSDGRYVDRTSGGDAQGGIAVGVIDPTGALAISPRFETFPRGYVFSFSEGLAKVTVKGKVGFIDRSGRFVIEPRLLDATDFSGGMARVVLEGPCVYFSEGPCPNPRFPGLAAEEESKPRAPDPACTFTYIDKSGRIVSRRRFDFGREFSEGLAPVRVGEFWGFIGADGEFAIPPQYADAEPFSSRLARIRVKERYGYADRSGRMVIAAEYVEAQSFHEGFAAVGDGRGRQWYINVQGKRGFPGEFAVASHFFKGLAHVKLRVRGESFAYIDTKGRLVFRY